MDVAGRRLVIFDFDGTLANTSPAIMRTASRVLLEHGVDKERLVDVGKLVGPPFPQAFTMVFGLDEKEALAVTHDYRAIYSKLGVEAWPLFEGMRELLEDLRAAGKMLAVASSKRVELLRHGLEDNDIADYFDYVFAKTSDAERTKAQTIASVLEATGCAPADAVMVGDRFYDVEGALACGVPCVGVEFGHTAEPGELEGAGACAVADEVDALRLLLLG